MRRILIACSFVLLAIAALAQDKKLTIEDIILKRGALTPQRLAQTQWIPGTDRYTYIQKGTLMSGGTKDTAITALLPLATLSSAAEKAGLSALKSMPDMKWSKENELSFTVSNKACIYNLVSGVLTAGAALPEGAEFTDAAPTTGHIAYLNKQNLYILSATGEQVAVSTDGNDGLVYGHSVHREEYGIEKGTFWSPDGNLLAFYRMDQSMVTDYPIYQLGERPAKAKMIKYPMAGMTSHQVTLGIFDTRTRKTIYVQTTGPADQYLTNISWSPDNKYVFIVVLNRKTDHLWFNQYDATTGAFVKTVFEETSDVWVEPVHPAVFVPGSNNQFIWQSERTGHNHLYLYDLNKGLVRALTSGNWDVIELNTFNEQGSLIYFTGTIDPTDRMGFTVDLNGKLTMLGKAKGTHQIIVNKHNGYYLDSYSSITTPREVTLNDPQGKTVKTLLKAPNPLAAYQLGEAKINLLESKDGTKLYSRMILPPGFDASKKYPSITYVYNGPHVQLITDTWLANADMWLYYLAQEGFIVFTVDGHGSGNRGIAFEGGIHRQLGSLEIEDQLIGNDYLRSLPYIDTTRMGVDGWSFGGFMTTSLMTRTAGRYAVGVAGGPVMDWRYYEIMYTERYMDTPDENPEGYEKACTYNYIDNLKGKLMLIHGTSDDVVLWQHSLLYIQKCVEKGKQLDYFVYPGHLHNVLGPDRVHLLRKITDYFKANL